ncbi:hypothetical protein DFA_02129 [Cavenderia fasciculata]|uniref:Uncharacterized protein n=1 Tax=Cavenderia fasciculata TaxID=261658 RepID=F4PYS6_CACFS|nr:uncharacterized protein DFA_02129 [Cavenderia fasciculata]EGG19342.1 hypothetical protein DFA_02129 [Cavenderia fasciculata]|eukprot:XP_004357613.1 hypothetical protein DFA_02129 [Cavenderia fasciculata]
MKFAYENFRNNFFVDSDDDDEDGYYYYGGDDSDDDDDDEYSYDEDDYSDDDDDDDEYDDEDDSDDESDEALDVDDEELVISTPGSKKAQMMADMVGQKCGLCGKKSNLTKTKCCGKWICSNSDPHLMFMNACDNCYHNHDQHSLCGMHHSRKHPGPWKNCKLCISEIPPKMYSMIAHNNFNF